MQEIPHCSIKKRGTTAGETPVKSNKDQNHDDIFAEVGLQRNRIAKLRKSRMEERVESSSLPICT